MGTAELDLVLEAWHRHTRILGNLAGLATPEAAQLRSSADGSTIAGHLCHIHETRYGWLGEVSKEHQAKLGEVFREVDGSWVPIEDLDEIKRQLAISAEAVPAAVRSLVDAGQTRVGPYSHPTFFLQHMLWHEGYHFGLITLALRNGGLEPSEEWEEENVWGIWRS